MTATSKQHVATLDEEQLLAATAPPGPLIVIAGAGTGKTTSLVARIEHQTAQGAWSAPHVLAVTHSTKAAGELRVRLSRGTGAAAQARTFHATAHHLLTEYWQETDLPGNGPRLIDSPFPLVRDALRRCGYREVDPGTVSDVVTAINWAQARLIDPEEYPPDKPAGVIPAKSVARVLALYRDELLTRGMLDFAGLLNHATQVCRIGHVARAVQETYRHVLVDEFQDSDPAQLAFTDALLGDRDDITVVGDPRQSIYAFKGAQPSVFDEFRSRYPGCTVINLTTNYRSTKEIVALANQANPVRHLPALAVGPASPSGPKPVLRACSDESAEAHLVAQMIKQKLDEGSVAANDIAILLRFNAQSAAFEQALTQADVPYTVLDHERFFDRPEVVTALRRAWSVMSLAEQSGDPLSGHEALSRALEDLGFDPKSRPEGAGAMADRWEAQRALLELAADCAPGDARPFLLELAHRRREAHTVTMQAVTVTTIHKAKGLEWSAVYIPRLIEGSMPSVYAKSAGDIAEEARLFYVAITRARHDLTLTYPAARTAAGGKRWKSEVSSFLAPLLPSLHSQHAQAKRHAVPGGHSSRVPAQPSGLTAQQRRVLDALRAWRAATAAEERLPDFSIAPDAALTAIAVMQPDVTHRLAMCGGFGAVRAKKYGDAVLRVIASVSN